MAKFRSQEETRAFGLLHCSTCSRFQRADFLRLRHDVCQEVTRRTTPSLQTTLAGALPGSTRQFIIDSRRGELGEVGSMAGGNASFNGGVITFIGGLGFANGALSENLGFDIFGPTGEAFVSVQSANGGISSFGTVNLATGAFTAVGDVDGGVGLRSITAIPTPGAVAVLGLGGLLVARRRR